MQDCDRPETSETDYEQPPPTQQEEQKPVVLASVEPGNVDLDYDEVEQPAIEKAIF